MRSAELQVVNVWLREHRMRIGDLAVRAGLTRTTVYNVLSGLSGSRIARQKLTNAVGVSIWPGCRPEPPLVLLKDDPSSLSTAIKIARQGPAGVQIEVIDSPSERATVGFLGSDGRGVLLGPTQTQQRDTSGPPPLRNKTGGSSL